MQKIDFREISDSEFDAFVKDRKDTSFQQNSYILSLQEKMGRETKLLGLSLDGQIVAAGAFILRKILWNYKVGLCVQGPVLNYYNPEIVDLFFKHLNQYLRKQHVIYNTILPNLELGKRDQDGNVLEAADWSFEQNLSKAKYKSFGKINDYKNIIQRFLFYKDFQDANGVPYHSEKKLFQSYTTKTRNLINKARKNMVKIEDGSDHLDVFVDIMEKTGERRGFRSRDAVYYKNFLESFGKDRSFILLAYLYPEEAIAELNQRKTDLMQEAKILSVKKENGNKKAVGKLKEINNQIEGVDNSLTFFDQFEDKDQKIYLSGALFVVYNQEMTYLFSGSLEEYFGLGAADLIQFEAQKTALEKGCDRYSFLGTLGAYSNSDDGIHAFKKGFGGRVLELPGAYYSVLHPLGKLVEYRYREP